MYLKDITNSPIADNDQAYLFVIEKNTYKPFLSISGEKDTDFKLIGKPMLANYSENILMPDESSSEFLFLKEYLKEQAIVIDKENPLSEQKLQLYYLEKKGKKEKTFNHWDKIDRSIFKQSLRVKAFSKALTLNYVSYCSIKKSVFDSIIKSYESKRLGKFNDFKKEYAKLFETKNKVQKVLDRNIEQRTKLFRFFSDHTFFSKEDALDLAPFIFVLNVLSDNGFYLEPYDFTYEGLSNCSFTKAMIDLENEKKQKIICKSESFKVLTWEQVEQIVNFKENGFNEINDLKLLIESQKDKEGRVILEKSFEREYLDNLSEVSLAFSNIKYYLNMNKENIIIQF